MHIADAPLIVCSCTNTLCIRLLQHHDRQFPCCPYTQIVADVLGRNVTAK